MDLNPIHHLSPGKKIKCSYFDYVQLLMLARLVNGLKPHPPPFCSQWNEMLLFGLCSLLMISQAGWWTQTPSATLSRQKNEMLIFCIMFNFWWLARLVNGLEPHPPPLSSQKKWNAHFWITFNFWWLAWLIHGLETPSAIPLQPKTWNATFCITFNFWCWPDWSMDSNPIHHPSAAKKMKCFFYYAQLLLIGWAEWWTQTPSTTPLQPKIMKCSFLDYVHFWWSAWLIDELNLICHPSPTKKIKWMITFNSNQAGQSATASPLQPIKWNASFWITFTSDDQPGWSMDSNPICHPSPAKKMKCSFLDYVQLLMISQAGWWTQTPSTTPLQPIKWNAHFWITFNFWWSVGLVDGLKPHSPPLSSPKMKCSFLIMFNIWWWAGLVNELNPHLPPLSSQKNEMLIFGLRSTSDDQLGWSMNSNPILHLSPAKKMKCSFLYYVHFWMISWAGRWTRTPSTTPLQPKQWNAHFWITFNIWCWPDWSMDLNPIHHPSPAKTVKCSFLYYIQHLMLTRLVNGLEPHPAPLPSQNMKCSFFGLCSSSED